jgi:endonuclease I
MKIPAATAALANLNHWRANQGADIKAKRPIQIYRACEHMAQQMAAVCDPLMLSRERPKKGGPSELEVCIKRALSQERYKLHGPLIGVPTDTWWEQIEAICRSWSLTMNRGDWESERERKAA